MRKLLFRVLGCAAVALSIPGGSLSAQQQKGDKELGIGGNLTVSIVDGDDEFGGGGTTTTGTVFGSLGVFMTRSLKLSGGGAVNLTNAGESGTSANTILLYGASYYFGGPGAKTYPYLGVGGATQLIEETEFTESTTKTTVSGIAGLQHYLNRNASLFAELNYSPSEGVVTIPITFGFRVVF